MNPKVRFVPKSMKTRRHSSPVASRSACAGAALLGLSVTMAHGATVVVASSDSRSDTSLTDPPLSAASTTDLAVGLVSSGRAFRTYLTFDLSAESIATGETTLELFDYGANENNSTSVAQTFVLFVLDSDWDGLAQPGPTGTTLASTSFTPATGNDSQSLSFTSAALTTAFNDALAGSGRLYLGIQSDLEGTAARSFKWFGSSEDPGFEPSLTYAPVPEPGVAGLAMLGLAGLMRRRRLRGRRGAA